MSNEVKEAEAAERLKKAVAAQAWVRRADPETLTDGGLIIQAYLDEHPADDGEAVTAEWLGAVGAIYLTADIGFVTDDRIAEPVLTWVLDSESETGISCPSIGGSDIGCNITTRGQVRQILSALGIELKESGDE